MGRKANSGNVYIRTIMITKEKYNITLINPKNK